MFLKKVIVGSCEYSLLKSYSERIPIVLVDYEPPTFDVKFEAPITVESLTTDSAAEVWYILKFLCSMSGLMVNPVSLEYLRLEGNNINFRGCDIEFESCSLFPSSKVKTDLNILRVENEDLHRVIDIMRLKFCNVSKVKPIHPEDTFIELLECFNKRDVIAVSKLTKEQLTNFDYSDTIVRFTAEKILLNNEDIHRPLINKLSPATRKPRLDVLERKVLPLAETVYEDTDKVTYYDWQKRQNTVKTYCGNNTSIKS